MRNVPMDAHVLGLLEEMLDSGKTPEEACRDCPEMLQVVRQRWQEFRRIDAEVGVWYPEPVTSVLVCSPDHATGADARPRLDASEANTLASPGHLLQIPGYEMEAVLGRGGMGIVYKARHLALNRTVALKMLLAGEYSGPHERARFQREAEAVAGLCHANIVQVYEVGVQEGRPYFTMELVDGGTLGQRLAAAPLPLGWTAELVALLAEAVSVAHCSGIIHRDLKPANILLTANGVPKISDFGLARRLNGEDALTWTGTALGTPSYMAPEQASGTGPVGPAADVYGLGAILYELLTGRPPFRAENPLETCRQVIEDEPVPPSRWNAWVPRDLETICLKCLHKEPERRYTSAAALAEDLRRYLLGQVVAARPVGPLERAGKWVRRNKWIAGLSAAAVCALVVGTVASLLFAFEASRQEKLATARSDELEEKTRIAIKNEREAVEAKLEAERVTVASLLIPIFGNAHYVTEPLGFAEMTALTQLRGARKEIQLQFLETGLRDPETARRVGLRADWIIQAIVGCDRALRAEVGQMVVRRIQEPGVPQEAMFACARLGLALNLDDPAWAERSAQALSVELRDPQGELKNSAALAESLAAVCVQLPRPQAAEHAARLIDRHLARLQDPLALTLGHNYLGPAIVALSPHLDTEAAHRAAKALGTIIRQSTSSAQAFEFLTKAQAAVCQRLPPPDAAAYLNGTVDFIIHTCSITKDKDKFRYGFYARTLAALSPHLDAPTASRAADAIIVMLGDSGTSGGVRIEFVADLVITEQLAKLAERLDAPGSLKATEALIPPLTKANNLAPNMQRLESALVVLARRLDANGAAQVADACAAAVRDPMTPVLPRALLARTFAEVSAQVNPARAALLESDIVDSLVANLASTDEKSLHARGHLGQALGSVCGRPSAKGAPRSAGVLTAAIADPQTPFMAVKPLAAALAVVCGQLPPAEASSHAKKVVDVLESLWVTRTRPMERAPLAQATAAVWTYLSPREATAHAKRLAADIQVAFRDSKADQSDLGLLAEALTAVCDQLDPTERIAPVNSALDVVVARLRKPKKTAIGSESFASAIGLLWPHLDQDAVARVGDTTLLAGLGISDPQRYQFEFQVNAFKRIAARMDVRDLERFLEQALTTRPVRRAVLDLLGESKNRYFRNTWDYLDWKQSNGSKSSEG
jgi:hypothetical protein